MKFITKIAHSRFALPVCGALALLSVCYTAFALRDLMQEHTVGMRHYIQTEPQTPQDAYIPEIPTEQERVEQESNLQDWQEVETFTARDEIVLPEASPEQEITQQITQPLPENVTTNANTTQKPTQKPTQTTKPQTTKPQTQKPTQSVTQKPQQTTQESVSKPVSGWSVTYAQAKKMVKSDAAYDYEDLYWLSRIISAEAKGESFTGQIGVGTVVLNRVRSREFPNTVKGVVFDTKYGTQFTPVANGTIYQAPTQSAIVAAKMCLDGYVLSDSVLYFLNPGIATSSWIQNNRRYAFRVGNHEFYH